MGGGKGGRDEEHQCCCGGQSTQGSAVVASHERTQRRRSPVSASIPGLASREGGCECGELQDDNTFLRKGKRKIYRDIWGSLTVWKVRQITLPKPETVHKLKDRFFRKKFCMHTRSIFFEEKSGEKRTIANAFSTCAFGVLSGRDSQLQVVRRSLSCLRGLGYKEEHENSYLKVKENSKLLPSSFPSDLTFQRRGAKSCERKKNEAPGTAHIYSLFFASTSLA